MKPQVRRSGWRRELLGVALAAFLLSFLGGEASSEARSSRPKGRAASTPWNSYKVERGDTVADIAGSLRVSEPDLRRWNHLGSREPRVGSRLRYQGARPTPQSIGAPWNGQLMAPVRLPYTGRGFEVAPRRARVWGTPETVGLVRKCLGVYRRSHPRKPSIPVGDLSSRNGGSAQPHVSHQSGRDVDVGYATVRPSPREFVRADAPGAIDPAREWTLLRCFLEAPATQMVIVHPRVVEAVKGHLEKTFRKNHRQRSRLLSLLEHKILLAPDHYSHMHVRVRCDRTDPACRG